MPVFRRISSLFSRSKVDWSIDEELRSHIEMRIDDNIAAGMSPRTARRDALRRFGNPTVVKEKVKEVDAALWVDGAGRDFIFGFRGLLRNKVFAASAILTIGLGVGASVVMFTVLSA